ncbi:MAG: hypothetical protein R2751_11130 [Bacteroidales bacterium]
MAGALSSCEILEECGTCALVTVDADSNTTYGADLPFCGDDLIDKQNSSPTTVGGITTYWECD